MLKKMNPLIMGAGLIIFGCIMANFVYWQTIKYITGLEAITSFLSFFDYVSPGGSSLSIMIGLILLCAFVLMSMIEINESTEKPPEKEKISFNKIVLSLSVIYVIFCMFSGYNNAQKILSGKDVFYTYETAVNKNGIQEKIKFLGGKGDRYFYLTEDNKTIIISNWRDFGNVIILTNDPSSIKINKNGNQHFGSSFYKERR